VNYARPATTHATSSVWSTSSTVDEFCWTHHRLAVAKFSKSSDRDKVPEIGLRLCFLNNWLLVTHRKIGPREQLNSFIYFIRTTTSDRHTHTGLQHTLSHTETLKPTEGTLCQLFLGLHSSSSSFICSNQLNKKTHTWATREQEQDKKGTENWRLHFVNKKTNTLDNYKNNYNYAYRKNAEKSTRLSNRLNIDNDEKSTTWGKKFQTFIILSRCTILYCFYDFLTFFLLALSLSV